MQLSAHNPGPVYKTQAGRAAGKTQLAGKAPGRLAQPVEQQQAADKEPDKVEQPDRSPAFERQVEQAADKAPDRSLSADRGPGKLARPVEQPVADKEPDKVAPQVEQPDQSPAVEQQAPAVEQAEQHTVADNMDFAQTPSARCQQSPRSSNLKWHS